MAINRNVKKSLNELKSEDALLHAVMSLMAEDVDGMYGYRMLLARLETYNRDSLKTILDFIETNDVDEAGYWLSSVTCFFDSEQFDIWVQRMVTTYSSVRALPNYDTNAAMQVFTGFPDGMPRRSEEEVKNILLVSCAVAFMPYNAIEKGYFLRMDEYHSTDEKIIARSGWVVKEMTAPARQLIIENPDKVSTMIDLIINDNDVTDVDALIAAVREGRSI